MRVEHRDERLLFEARQRRVLPGQRRAVGDVGEAHRRARVTLAGRTDGSRDPVGERELRPVARRAALRAVSRKPRVVEQVTAELDLLFRQRVVGRHAGRGEPRGQLPLPRVGAHALVIGPARGIGGRRGNERERQNDPRDPAGVSPHASYQSVSFSSETDLVWPAISARSATQAEKASICSEEAPFGGAATHFCIASSSAGA